MRQLVIGDVVATGVDQAAAVHEGHRRARLVGSQPFRDQLAREHARDADAGRAGADQHEALAAQAALRAARRQQAGEDDRAGALDVVVEARQPVAIAIQDAQGVVLLEVLPLQHGCREDRLDGLDERLEDLVVVLAAQAR